MLPVSFPGCNINFGPPLSMSDEQCATVPALIFGIDKQVIVRLCIRPGYEDVQAMEREPKFILKVIGEFAFKFKLHVNFEYQHYEHDHSGIDEAKNKYIAFIVTLTEKAVLAIKNDHPIFFDVYANGIQPFIMFTINDKGEANV